MSSQNSEFCLSLNCVKNAPFDKYENDFTFIIRNKRYETSRFVADLISPRIRKLHYVDPSLNEFFIDMTTFNEDQNSTKDYFDEFLSLIKFDPRTIEPNIQKYFLHYFYKLGNIEEYFRLQPDFQKTFKVDNILELIQNFVKIQNENDETITATSNIYEDMIQFASEHFEELDKEKMKNLPNEVISDIFQNEKLKLIEEDSLLEIILKLYEEDSSYSNLFEYVQFVNVSEEKLKKFVNEFRVEFINDRIFQSICDRFFKSKEYNENRYINGENYKEFKPKEDEDFNGIFRYLTNQTGGNIHDNNTIEISSNSISGSSNHPKYSLDYQNNNIYHSKDDKESYVCIDFKDKSVQISSYSIKSTPGNVVHMKNWVIEVSENGQNWTEIDSRSNDSTLNSCNNKSRFDVKKPQKGFYRFMRLRETGEQWNGHYIGFVFIELYGKLKEAKT